MGKDKALNIWFKTLKTSLKIPGAIVDRSEFLSSEFQKHCTEEQMLLLLKDGPQKAGLNAKLIEKTAKRVIRIETAETGSLSFAAGLPGGFLMAATVPADLIQFHLHELLMIQKLAYLYGRETIISPETRKVKRNLLYLTLLFGVAYNADDAADSLIEFEDFDALVDFEKQFEQGAVARAALQTARWLGVRILKSLTKSGSAKIVPLVGGIVSGGLSVWSMRKSSSRLHDFFLENTKDELIA